MSTLRVEGIKNAAASSDAITLAADGTCIAKATNKPGRNLIINGAMQVAQRGTSSTTSGIYTVDRFSSTYSGQDEATTQTQHALTSSDTGPWEKGFRYSWHIQNGNQTGGAGASDMIRTYYCIEAQDVAQSGWDYTSSSSYITLSFWVRSSVAQNFYGHLRTMDGTSQSYPFETGSLSANTWTKVTKKIPGNSNLQFDNDANAGLYIYFFPFTGTTYTGSVSLNTWAAYASGTRTPDQTSTWYTTNDATIEFTGYQLEVGDTSTDYEHRSYGDELLRCQRYYLIWADHTLAGGDEPIGCSFYNNGNYKYYADCRFPVEMRANASVIVSNSSNHFRTYGDGAGANCDTLTYDQLTKRVARVGATTSLDKKVAGLRAQAGGYLHFNAEL